MLQGWCCPQLGQLAGMASLAMDQTVSTVKMRVNTHTGINISRFQIIMYTLCGEV